ncbi:MAG: NAD(P)/FAD-dependent oxidoreductase [Kofleriaceae bacterium]|nr:NAD(P)/FAD-dependent oxidoreductase [Myxococcales bacterium]MCB9561988.1 NAD(P)/FAD-dependent oxidoreductase [Kofleriaceae bacterium]MCB9573156.1 NAD(P)/FAD-dependent oxidoreductase [Kofleriaceae bacterium]
MSEHLDVVIVGAGLSGVAAAYHLQTALPAKRYAVLEGRGAIGGTWDLFRYPGIRSDSDMYTLGYSFRPWRSDAALADGPSIRTYIEDTARDHGIDRKIRFHHRVERAAWSSATSRWTLEGTRVDDGTPFSLTCGFLFMCSGYYAYDAGHTPAIPGADQFGGRIVHPQAWPEDLDYAGKRVIVIGSGATAVTLVPELAKQAAHVTMLQRSPTYVVSRPPTDKIASWLQRRLPAGVAHDLTRWKNVMLGKAFYDFCRRFPDAARRMITRGVRAQLGPDFDVATHFSPRYAPWDQRLCLVPDNDLFRAIRGGGVDVVTDEIERYSATGLALRSGRRLDADLVVTATGLRLLFLGGLRLTVDGKAVDPATRKVYKGAMISGVPNLALALGYTNASWTLKCELIVQYVCRLLAYMDRHDFASCVPRPGADVGDEPLLDLSSGYVQRALPGLPRQGSKVPWKLYQSYVRDLAMLRHGKLADGNLVFTAASARDRAYATTATPAATATGARPG